MDETFESIGIELKGNSNQQKSKCPNCAKIGKENYKDNCLAVNLQEGIYYCHKCNWQGKVSNNPQTLSDIIPKKKMYKKPERSKLKKLTKRGANFLIKRGITEDVIKANKIVSSSDGKSIVFPYLKESTIVNYKSRGIDGKWFTQSKDAEPIIYNYDRCIASKAIVICEGEMDSLSWEVSGIYAHTSVNMGAPNIGDKNIDGKLECISNCYEVFEQAETVYIATDNDDNGRNLEKELVRRIGDDKCLLVDLKPYKDANEVLIAEGVESLRNRLKNASSPKLEGVFSVDDVRESMLDGFHNGQDRGTTTYIPQIDKAWTWRNGEVNIWTGYQNEGKSMFLNQLACIKSIQDNWKFAVFSPENMPMNDFFNDIIEMYVGKSADPYYKSNQMKLEEYKEAMDFARKHFFLIYPKKNFTLDSIFSRAKHLVKTKGIRSLIIDPYNTVQHKMLRGEREDLYISRFMSELKRFALDNNISVHLVAHQVTPHKDDNGRYIKPDVNRIKGGGTFADKADNVMFVWRPNRGLDFSDSCVTFGSQKIKKQKLVGIPQEVDAIDFNIKTQRYLFNGCTPFTQIDLDRSESKYDITDSGF